jgi:hypothetical protein
MSESPADNLPSVEPVAPPQPRRKRRWLRRIAVALLVLVAAVAAAYMILSWQVERHLEEVKAHLSFKLVPAKDLPTLWGPPPKPEDNAAPLYAEISEKLSAWVNSANVEEEENEFERLEVIWGVHGPDYWPDEHPDPRWKAIVNDMIKTGKHVWTPDEMANCSNINKPPPSVPSRDPARAHNFLGQFSEVFKLRDEAARRPGYRRDTDWSHYLDAAPLYSELRRLSRLSVLQSAVAADEGRWDEAYQDLFTVGILAHHLEQEQYYIQLIIEMTLYGDMVRPLADLIHRHPPTGKQAEELRLLLKFDAKGRLRDNLIGECVRGNGSYERFLSRTKLPKTFTIPHLVCLSSLYLKDDLAFYLEMFDSFVRATDLPIDRSLAEMPTLEKRFKESSRWRFINSRLILPSIGGRNTLKRCVCCQAWDDMLIVALDLSAYRQKHGKYPAALAELPNAGKLPRDPFTETGAGGRENEQPFHYRLVGEGFVLWSVGPQGKDGAEATVERLEEENGPQHVYLRVPPKPWAAVGEKP